MAKKKQNLTEEELLKQALVPESEWPYKVPENWVWTNVEAISELKSGTTIPAINEIEKGEIPYLKVADMNLEDNTVAINTSSRFANIFSKNNIIPKGSIIFPKRGGAIFTNKKRLVKNIEILADLNIMAIIPKMDKSTMYIYYWFLTIDLGQLNNGSNVPQINNKDIYPLKFPLPPKEEQQRIVTQIENLFEKLDQAKGLIQDALDSFENRKAAILHKAFSGELTRAWREENGVELDSWISTRLIEVCKINPPKISTKELSDDLAVSFIPMQAVSDVLGTIEEPQIRKLEQVKKGYTNFIEDDIIFAKITPCMENGKTAIVGKLINDVGFGSTEFHVVRCSDRINKYYAYHLLRSQYFRDEARAVMTGAVGQQRVPKSFLENYQMELPTYDEQLEIIRIINELYNKEQSANELCELIENIVLMKKSILARAFRGELGTNDPTEESAMKLLKEILEN